MNEATPKTRLLTAVVGVALTEGVADKSLRAIAAAAGTSHRMLIHHFGSREGLLVAVIQEVEARQRALLAELGAGPGEDPGEELGRDPVGREMRWWEHLRSPELAAQERLFFEVYGQALQGRAWARPMLDGIVENWVAPVAETLEAGGAGPETARAMARLSVAVGRGLLLDVLATGDNNGVDAAMRLFLTMGAAWLAREDPGAAEGRSDP
jgi:AcrR family transcriptional regulator